MEGRDELVMGGTLYKKSNGRVGRRQQSSITTIQENIIPSFSSVTFQTTYITIPNYVDYITQHVFYNAYLEN
jgi:hypothetical protein